MEESLKFVVIKFEKLSEMLETIYQDNIVDVSDEYFDEDNSEM